MRSLSPAAAERSPESDKARAAAAFTVAALVLLVAFAFFLRLYRLDGRSLWLDEILTAQTAHLDGPSAVVAWSRAAINQMPLFYMCIWLVGHWGDSAFLLRLPAAIAGTLLVPAVYLLGRSLLGARVGLIAALITTVLPFTVWYSQEARSYSLLMLLTTLLMYSAFLAVVRANLLGWAGLALFGILDLYTHYVAIAALVAVTVFVGAFVAVDLFKGTSTRAKAIAGGVALATVVVALVERTAILDLVFTLIARAHGHRALLLAIAAVSAVMLAAIGVAGWRLSPAIRNALSSRRLRRLELAAAAAAAVAIAYAPWLSALRRFLSRPDQSLGQIHVAHQPGLADLASTLSGLSLTGLPLIFLVVGLAAVIFWTFTGRAAACGLLLAWIGVPLAILTMSAGASILAIDPRYVSFLVPAFVIVIAAGVEAAVTAARWAASRLSRAQWVRAPRVALAATAVLTALLLAQIVPALATSYGSVKNDWRGAAEQVAAANPVAAAVISLGDYADWSVICLHYYFAEMHRPIPVDDGRFLDPDLAGRLESSTGRVWGIVIFPSPRQLALISGSSVVETTFVDATSSIWLVQVADHSLPPLDQAMALLRWELPLQPALASSLSQLGSSGST